MQTRKQKETEVEGLRERITRASSIVLADYRGLSVIQANDLRARLLKDGEGQFEYRVVKNTLMRRAVEGTSAEGVTEHLTGPTALALAFEEPGALAKSLVDFAKENEIFEIKGGVVDGDVVDLAGIRALAALPTKTELRGMLAGTLQAPLRNLAGTLQSLLGHVRGALEERQNQLESTS